LTPLLETRPCRVSLDVFDGPLDLLLHLVKERQLDIATVPLASVAQQYFEYIAMMEALDVELAAEYLVIAATLVFLKSRALLPPVPSGFLSDGEETPEQVEEQLRARLIAYSRYKAVADDLRVRAAEAAAFMLRDAGDPGTEVAQRYRLDPTRLAGAFLAALRDAKPERRTIARERISLVAQMSFVLGAVRDHGPLGFEDLCRGFTRDRIIVTFLAVLELLRQGRLAFEQSSPHHSLRLLPFAPVALHAN
jgi:segregation and condensation protein A